jgi:hypothetical protein
LNQHKGPLPVSRYPDQHWPVRIKLAGNILKIVHVRNCLSIDLFDYIPRPELLRCAGVGINARDDHSIHVCRNVRFGPKLLRKVRDFDSGKNRIL